MFHVTMKVLSDFIFGFCVCRKRMAATELSKSMNDFLSKLQDDLKEAMNTMMCTKCEGKHKCVLQIIVSVLSFHTDLVLHSMLCFHVHLSMASSAGASS